jgi:adenosylcobinamide kinase / adenosylcobinamide-phosphate guanylyltransferase
MAELSIARSELILGGQKSGKTARAEMLAAAWLAQAPEHRAVYIATAQAWDEEMRDRIARHQRQRAERVPRMATVEEPLELAHAIGRHSRADTLIVVDCLTLWLTALLMPAVRAGDQASPHPNPPPEGEGTGNAREASPHPNPPPEGEGTGNAREASPHPNPSPEGEWTSNAREASSQPNPPPAGEGTSSGKGTSKGEETGTGVGNSDAAEFSFSLSPWERAGVRAPAATIADALRSCAGPIVLISNEIGAGVIPLGRDTRAFVDALGGLNQQAAAACERVTLMSAGLPLTLKGAA